MAHVIQLVKSFFERHFTDDTRPVLLALSGGCDSLALFYLLIDLKLPFAVAHVDHGWREESRQESEEIFRLASQYATPCHLKQLDPSQMKGNLEAACREERLHFFADLIDSHSYQAVLMGHHADDLAETVLKRLLEGAFLTHLKGMEPIAMWKKMAIWRPLLAVRKKEIISWLVEREVSWFEDHTNQDRRFLRARMRQEILPYLKERVGKEVVGGLCCVSEDAAEVGRYLDHRTAAVLPLKEVGPWGVLLDLKNQNLDPLEAKYLVRKCCEERGICCSRTGVHDIVRFLLAGDANKQVVFSSNRVYIDRGKLFFVTRPLPIALSEKVFFDRPGIFRYGSWTVEVRKRADGEQRQWGGWQQVWKGRIEMDIPCGTYSLEEPNVRSGYPASSPLDKWWTECRVPAFLRRCVPVICCEGKIYSELLSGKSVGEESPHQEYFRCLISAAIPAEKPTYFRDTLK